MKDPFKTHGAFSWNELMTSDPAAAKKFYSNCWAGRWKNGMNSSAAGKKTSGTV